MNKQEFLRALEAEFEGFSFDRLTEVLDFYGEMIDERVESGMTEEEAVEKIGSPRDAAAGIIEQEGLKKKPEENASPEEIIISLDKKGHKEIRISPNGISLPGILISSDKIDLSGEEGEKLEMTVSDPFDAVKIFVCSADVRIGRSEDDRTHVVNYGGKEDDFEISVQDGTLFIRQSEKKAWSIFCRKYSMQSGDLGLFLPEKAYRLLEVKNKSGDLEMGGNMEINEIQMTLGSGDIRFFGFYRVGTVSFLTKAGDIEAQEVECEAMKAMSDAGDIRIENVVAKTKLEVESNAGDLLTMNCEAEEEYLRTGAGDIDGKLRSPKQIIAECGVGECHVPESKTGAQTVFVKSGAGDINLTY